MEKDIISKHPVHELLDDLFTKKEIRDVIAEFQRKNSSRSKWMMFSDYCLDDKNKANDVITFVLMPYVDEEEYYKMQQKIHETQPFDIKETNKVRKAFLSYLRNENMLIFSFVLNDRKHVLAPLHNQCVQGIKETLKTICECYGEWMNTIDKEEVKKYNKDVVLNINRLIASLNGKNPDIKLLNDILITAFLGAYVSTKALERIQIEVFGWFSDRDRIISGKNNIVVPIFYYYQYNMLGGHQYQFCTFTPDDTKKPFFDDFNRIADVITGAIADYNIDEDYITADKFNTVLVDLLADNKQALIFRIYRMDGDYRVGWITMHPK